MSSKQGNSGMGGQAEGICPLCMEEMDRTDQELQPCFCGYQICVWCWNQIIQTTAKNGSDACCPACRSLYDKEKILKRSISKESSLETRLAELHVNKKEKLQKERQHVSDVGKDLKKEKFQNERQQVSDIGKDLNNVRVIRRNMVYLAGIHINLANEKILRKKEYLGQYGRILKIVITQTDGSRQHYSSDTCIVYVTYSKEEEALRCIQVVNGYILDGRPLKACFGTTRFCYIWLKNQTCNNPNCVFVHNVVPQEDICIRDEVISFCTSKLQQYSGIALNLKHHSGSVLPPPLDPKNTASQLGLINISSKNPSRDIGRSYASVAASDNQSKPLSMNTGLIMTSDDAEDQIPWVNNELSNQFSSYKSKGNLKTSAHDTLFLGIDHQDVANMVSEDSRPAFADGDYMPSRSSEECFSLFSTGCNHILPNSANATACSSACSFNSSSKRGKCNFETLRSAAFDCSSFWEDPVSLSQKNDPFSFIEALSGDSLTVQKSLPSYDWDGLHSNLIFEKINGGFKDDRFSAQCEKGLESFSAPTISSTSCHAYFPTGSVMCTSEQKRLYNNSLNYGGLDFEFSQADRNKDLKFLQMKIIKGSYSSDEDTVRIQKSSTSSSQSLVNKPEDRILSDILGLKLDVNDYQTEHRVVEQLYSFDGLSSVSKSLLASTRDKSKHYISIMDDLRAASGNLSILSVGKSGIVEAGDYENSRNISGSQWSRAVYQRPYSRSSQRTSLSTPPGFPPKRSDC